MSAIDCEHRSAFRIHMETFGCQMNVLDSQLVTGALQALGFEFVDDWQSADVVLYNTCSVRQHAEQKVCSRLGEAGLYKKQFRPQMVLGVIGCMAEREGSRLLRRYPQVDLLCGPGELDKIPMLIDNVLKTSGKRRRQTALQGNTHRRWSTLGAVEDRLELLDLSRSFLPENVGNSAYVRITRGCNKFCSFCVVPATRGREVHRPPNHVVAECRRLVEAGAVEITLLGQTINHYHYDHGAAISLDGVQQPQVGAAVRAAGSSKASRRLTSFADLMGRIHEEVPALQRLRFVTSYPRDFGDDILAVMRSCRRICRYLHLPVQSGSNRILKLMNRGYTVQMYLELIDRVRSTLPDAQIATDIICGFPTETSADHQATAGLLQRCRCKNAFIFKYSARPGTTAKERHRDDVPDELKRIRNNELLALQSRISAEVHETFVGRRLKVFVESISRKTQKARNAADPSICLGWQDSTTQLCGRSEGDLIVLFNGDESLIGSIVEVQIQRAAPLTLFGHLAEGFAAGPAIRAGQTRTAAI